MQAKSVPFTQPALVVLLAAAGIATAMAQNPSTAVADRLRTYKLVKLAPDSGGLSVVQPGTVLTIQQGGLLGVPPQKLVSCSATFQDGQMKAPGGFCAGFARRYSRFFQVGEKVYPWKIDVNAKKEEISFKVVACDSCNGTDPPTFYKSEVTFRFPQGFLETAQAGAVEQTIRQVFTLDDSDAQQAQGQPATVAAAPAMQPVQQAAPAGIAPPPPPTDQPPATIALGQTMDQVAAALGQPQRIANVGVKQIYFFKDLKVTFTNGKVSDVE